MKTILCAMLLFAVACGDNLTPATPDGGDVTSDASQRPHDCKISCAPGTGVALCTGGDVRQCIDDCITDTASDDWCPPTVGTHPPVDITPDAGCGTPEIDSGLRCPPEHTDTTCPNNCCWPIDAGV